MPRTGRPGLSPQEKLELWNRWKDGQSLSEIGRALGKHAGSIHTVLAAKGGIMPRIRVRSAIMQIANEWESSRTTTRESVLSIDEVHEIAVPLVTKRRGGEQIPIASFPRNTPRFPFAVKA